jgi:hypothetical protein
MLLAARYLHWRAEALRHCASWCCGDEDGGEAHARELLATEALHVKERAHTILSQLCSADVAVLNGKNSFCMVVRALRPALALGKTSEKHCMKAGEGRKSR